MSRSILPPNEPLRTRSSDVTLPAATLERFRDGDPEAFEAFVRGFAPLVRSIVAKYFRGAFEREEAAQEVWMQCFRQREYLDPSRAEEARGWLAVLARRRCVDLLRSAGRERPAEPLDELAQGAPAAGPDQLAAAEAEELSRAVAAFEAKLEGDWRGFFRLHFVEGLPYEEVAERLSISRLRCKYLKKVLAARARTEPTLLSALGRYLRAGGDLAP